MSLLLWNECGMTIVKKSSQTRPSCEPKPMKLALYANQSKRDSEIF